MNFNFLAQLTAGNDAIQGVLILDSWKESLVVYGCPEDPKGLAFSV